MGDVEVGRRLEVAVRAERLGADVGVLLPELHVLRHLVEHLRPLAVPVGMRLPVEDGVGHVAGADDGAGHDAGYLLPRSGETEDVPGKHPDALPRLLQTSRRLRGLGVVDDDEAGTDVAPVGALVFHAADSPGDPRHADDDAGRRTPGDGRQHDFVGSPRDSRPFALVELTGAPVGDAVQSGDGEADLGKIGVEMLVDVQLGLDGLQHLQRRRLGRADQHHEFAVAVEHRPQGGALRERRLPRAARHGEREETAAENRRLDPVDDLEVVFAPRERERLGKVAFAEQPEVRPAPLLEFGVLHLGQFPDVASGERQRDVAVADGVLLVLVTLGDGGLPDVQLLPKPRRVFE